MALSASASADLLAHCLEEGWDLTAFPKAIGTAVILCYHTLSMGVCHFQRQHPAEPLPPVLGEQTSEHLRDIETYLDRSCPALRHMLHRTQSTLSEYRRQLTIAASPATATTSSTTATAAQTDLTGPSGGPHPQLSFNFNVDPSSSATGPAAGSGSGPFWMSHPSTLNPQQQFTHPHHAHTQSSRPGAGGTGSTGIAGSGRFDPIAAGIGTSTLHWDPFSELAHGWNWQQSHVGADGTTDSFLDTLLR